MKTRQDVVTRMGCASSIGAISAADRARVEAILPGCLRSLREQGCVVSELAFPCPDEFEMVFIKSGRRWLGGGDKTGMRMRSGRDTVGVKADGTVDITSYGEFQGREVRTNSVIAGDKVSTDIYHDGVLTVEMIVVSGVPQKYVVHADGVGMNMLTGEPVEQVVG